MDDETIIENRKNRYTRKTRLKRASYSRDYYRLNRERILKQKREYYLANSERIVKATAAYKRECAEMRNV